MTEGKFKMKAIFTVGLLLLISCCQREEQPRSVAAKRSEEMHNQIRHNVTVFQSTHRISNQTPYYKSGPQQARAADGMLPIGTPVKLVENSGSYSVIVTESGVRAYVLTEDLEFTNQ